MSSGPKTKAVKVLHMSIRHQGSCLLTRHKMFREELCELCLGVWCGIQQIVVEFNKIAITYLLLYIRTNIPTQSSYNNDVN